MMPLFLQDYVNTIVCGDAIERLSVLPEGSVDVVMTDPPWPETAVDFDIDPAELLVMWKGACREICRVTDRVLVILGCDTNPSFLAPITLPFFRVIWLRRIPPVYRGSLLYGSDVAYLFGHRRLNGVHRVIGGEINSGIRPRGDNPHPCFRNLNHMRKLVEYLSKPNQLILDPFCGSGTTCQAARDLERLYYGIDENPTYVAYAINRLKGVQGNKDVEPRTVPR